MDVAEWAGIRIFSESTRKFAAPGRYQVCLSVGGAAARAIPSATGQLYFEIEALEGDSAHPRDVFSHQVLSGRREVPGAFDGANTFTLAGHRLFIPSTSRMTVQTMPCGSPLSFPIVDMAVSEGLSSPDGYVFEGTVFMGEAGSDFTVCYCDSQTDDTLEPGGETYKVSENSACSATPVGAVAPTGGLLAKSAIDSDYAFDFCGKKCAHGCVGQDCFCDSFDPVSMYDAATVDDMTLAAPLCLSATKCRDACAASPACSRFDFQPETNFCWLVGATDAANCAEGDLRYTETTESWMKYNGTACSNLTHDDWRQVGVMTLANRASIGNDWVLTPSAGLGSDYVPVQSIEVTGVNMSHSYDRIMFVECTGTCGVSGPVSSVRALIGGGAPRTPTLEMFRSWVAENDDYDPPHEPPSLTESELNPVESVTYDVIPGKYCPGNNLDISSPAMFDLGIAEHQCFRKCVTNFLCDSTDCFCDGLFEDFDDAESSALCMDQHMCEEACRSLQDCHSFDMHADKPRCFLNSVVKGMDDALGCNEVDYASMTTYKYNLAVKVMAAPPVRARQLSPRRLATGDLLSTDEVLRFRGLAFASGGKFKACFCDTDTLPFGTDSKCLTPADYKVEIGSVHVSGVSCLISEPKFQRGTCVPQEYGGLRCYAHRDLVPVFTKVTRSIEVQTPPPSPVGPPPAETVPVPAPTPPPSPSMVVPGPVGTLSSWCFFGPEEITRDDAGCNYQP
jgi:hypothetical protein